MIDHATDRARGSTAPAATTLAAWYTEGVSDWLGDRLLLYDNSHGPSFELLRLRPEFSGDAAFTDALGRRLAELRDLNSRYFAPVRGIERLTDARNSVAVIFENVGRGGSVRFPAIGIGTHRRLDARTFFGIAQQLTEATAALHRVAPTVSHGILEPARLAVTVDGHIAIHDHVFGSAVAAAQFGVPPAAPWGVAPFGAEDQRRDLFQIGLMLLSWLAASDPGIERDAEGLAEMLAHVPEALRGSIPPAAAEQFLAWLARAVQLDGDRSFASAVDALAAFRDLTIDQSHAGEHLAALAAPAGAAAPARVQEPPEANGQPTRINARIRPPATFSEEEAAERYAVHSQAALDSFPNEIDAAEWAGATPTESVPVVSLTYEAADHSDVPPSRAWIPAWRPPLWLAASLGVVALIEAVVIGLMLVRVVSPQKPISQVQSPNAIAAE